MTSFFVLGGSSPFNVLGDELVADKVEGCILDEDFELDVEVVQGLSSWFLSFSRRFFKYKALSILESDLWCPVAVDSTCSVPQNNQIKLTTRLEIDIHHATNLLSMHSLSV